MRLFQVNEDLEDLPEGHWYRWPKGYPYVVKCFKTNEYSDKYDSDVVQDMMDWLIETVDHRLWTVMGETKQIEIVQAEWLYRLVNDTTKKSYGNNSVFDHALMNELLFCKSYIFFKRVEDFILFKLTWM